MGNEIPRHVEQAQKTGVLQLRDFKLDKVPVEIIPITKYLRNLDLSNNKLKQLPAELFLKAAILKILNISNNKLESLPTQIGLLIKLETFNVSENLLRQVPSSIGQLKNLKLVNLSKNSLSSIPQELCALKQLDHLDLSSNRIEIVDDYIGELSCIELNLNENRVKQISGNLSKCSRLKVVRLEQNLLEIGSIPVCVLADSKVSLISLDGNLFTQKQLEQVEGYDKYMERYTATKRKFD